ncbi:MAG: hypothetical protein QG604_275 [Candidatus Dependentiae bacterium]|nr:hypothetical protein [Candidatus Dependentiae bacterium]
MKRVYISYIAIAAALVGQMQAADNVPLVMQQRQSSPWYSNNFGASAEQHFPIIKPETMTTRMASSEVAHNAIGLFRDDVDFLVSGRVRQEGQIFDRPLTMRDDFNDVYAFVRSKLNLDFHSQYGRRSYGKPAAQMGMRLTTFTLWADPYIYTPILSEKVYYHATNFLKKAEISEHHHRGVVPLVFLEEGWIKINFDTFLAGLNFPLSLQVGTFPFIVGRGISLGDYFEGGVEAFGFERRGDIGNAPQRPDGLLISAGIGEHGIAEFYYSKWRKRSSGPDWTREEVNAKRLDRDETLDVRNIERGTHSDTDIFAARFGYNVQLSDEDQVVKHTLYMEPYAVYLSAPELKVEFDADAGLRQGTVGFMAEYAHGNWSVNFEMAAQYGKQHMYPIDRNHLVIDDAYYTQTATLFDGASPTSSAVAGRLDKQIGQPMKYQSHVFVGIETPGSDPVTSEYLPYHAYYVSDEMQHINADRTPAEQGGQIRNAAPLHSTDTFVAGNKYVSQKATADTGTFGNSSLYSQYQFKTGVAYYDNLFGFLSAAPDGSLFNANLPFGAQRRFRNDYTVTNLGAMAMLDVRYSLPKDRVNFSFAAGYVGGDAYPFQPDELDKQTNHFMPLRDANYVGRYVTSFVMLYPRKFPRPMEMSDNDLFAHNNYKTMQNLQYLGFGSQWYPLESGTLMLEGNAIYFWEVAPPHKWNTHQDRTFPHNTSSSDGAGKEDSLYKFIQQNEVHFSGSSTTELASKQLGLELNVVIAWRPYKSLQFDLRAGIFLPGKLYSDIQGCPNINTRRVDQKGEWHYDSLGTQMVSGGQMRVTYKF